MSGDERPPAEAVLAILAPHGITTVPHSSSLLDVRCSCSRILVRILPARGHELLVLRYHSAPTQWQLAEKAEGRWPGGRQVEPDFTPGPDGASIRKYMSTPVGWSDHPEWLDLVPTAVLTAHCQCGLTLVVPTAQVHAWRRAGQRSLPAPHEVLLTREQHDLHLDALLQRWPMTLGDTPTGES